MQIFEDETFVLGGVETERSAQTFFYFKNFIVQNRERRFLKLFKKRRFCATCTIFYWFSINLFVLLLSILLKALRLQQSLHLVHLQTMLQIQPGQFSLSREEELHIYEGCLHVLQGLLWHLRNIHR